METTKNECGYEYTLALCHAIGLLTAHEEKENPSMFLYRSSNLKYAIERSLYFTYAEDDFLYTVFQEWKTNTLKDKIIVDDLIQKKLISLMCMIPQERILLRNPEPKETIKIFIKTIVRHILGLGVADIVSNIRLYINRRDQENTSYDVLFFVLNERFTKYMKPILHAMPNSTTTAYITHDHTTEKYLEQEKLPYVHISHFLYRLTRWSEPESWIKRFCLAEQYDILFDTLARIHPKSVVLVEGGAPTYEVINQICKQLHIQSVCIQQGWAPIIHNGFQNMSYTKMLVWGEGFVDALQSYNPKQNFMVTGSFAIKKTDGAAARNRDKEKIRLGFLPPMRTMILSQEKLDKFMTLIPWAAHAFPHVEIRVSLHPTINSTELTQKLSPYTNVTFLSSRTKTLEEIIAGNDIAVSFFSTTILESIAAGAVPIIVNLTAMPKYFPDVDTAGAGVEVRSVEEAQKILRELIEEPDKISNFYTHMEKFRETYFAYDRGVAMKNIVREIVT